VPLLLPVGIYIESSTTDISLKIGQIGHWLTASAVLNADIALGTHVQPRLKSILEGYGGDIEVTTQALKAEILLFFHGLNVVGVWRKCKGEIAIDSQCLGLNSTTWM
jgi:hypothetical protein